MRRACLLLIICLLVPLSFAQESKAIAERGYFSYVLLGDLLIPPGNFSAISVYPYLGIDRDTYHNATLINSTVSFTCNGNVSLHIYNATVLIDPVTNQTSWAWEIVRTESYFAFFSQNVSGQVVFDWYEGFYLPETGFYWTSTGGIFFTNLSNYTIEVQTTRVNLWEVWWLEDGEMTTPPPPPPRTTTTTTTTTTETPASSTETTNDSGTPIGPNLFLSLSYVAAFGTTAVNIVIFANFRIHRRREG